MSDGDSPESKVGRRERTLALWHRVRSGEDPLAFGVVVVVLALVAGFVWFRLGSRHGAIEPAAAAALPPAAEAAPAAPPTPVPAVTIHVAGAVAHPGLYRLAPGSRVADGLAAAGGSLARADLDRLNLAARLVDGQRVAVPRRGEPSVAAAAAGSDGAMDDDPGAGAGAGAGPPEPIDLNTAGLAALDSLPGIGPATARSILEERARRGGFHSPRDLLRIPGFGEARFGRLKDRVRV